MDVLNITMDALFESKELKSWTTHENSHSIVLTLRFGKGSHIESHGTGTESRSYKKRSQKESDRNKDRFNSWKSKQHPMITRKDAQSPSVEEKRSSDILDSAVSESIPAVSPVYVCDTPERSVLADVPNAFDSSTYSMAESFSSEKSPLPIHMECTETVTTPATPPESVLTEPLPLSESESTCDDSTDEEWEDRGPQDKDYCDDLQCSYSARSHIMNTTHAQRNERIYHRRPEDYSVCTRCEDSRAKLIADGELYTKPLIVCDKCRFMHRKHNRHRKYLAKTSEDDLDILCNFQGCKNPSTCEGRNVYCVIPTE